MLWIIQNQHWILRELKTPNSENKKNVKLTATAWLLLQMNTSNIVLNTGNNEGIV